MKLLLLLLVVAAQDVQWQRVKLCASVTPTILDYPWHGGARTVIVNDSEPCVWLAISPQSWITVPDEKSGQNGAQIAVVVPMNRGPERWGSITIGKSKVIVRQKRGRL